MVQNNFQIETSLLQLISSEQAYHYNIIPVGAHNGTLTFKSSEPSEDLKKELRVVFGKHIELLPETPENIHRYLSFNFRKQQPLKAEGLQYSNDFLEKLLLSAKAIGSSDIHFEP
jgi:type IV pilus assembly protein PilB